MAGTRTNGARGGPLLPQAAVTIRAAAMPLQRPALSERNRGAATVTRVEGPVLSERDRGAATVRRVEGPVLSERDRGAATVRRVEGLTGCIWIDLRSSRYRPASVARTAHRS